MSPWTIVTTVVLMTALAFAVSTFAEPVAAPGATMGASAESLKLTDLNLGSETGAATALARIERTVVAGCGEAPSPASQAATAAYRRCASDAVMPALAPLEAPIASAVDTGNRDLVMFVASR
ncbi:MAG TPA: UrcA family protein [Caulobacteraceae bacterium]